MTARLWQAPEPLVLASGSRIRADMLRAAGIPIEILAADVDERALETPLIEAGESPAAIARLLARAKAENVAARKPGRIVLGADQVLALGSERFVKPVDRASARDQLRRLSGRRHRLHSASALVIGSKAASETLAVESVAELTVRPLSDAFLEAYLDAAGSAVEQSVGGYQLEGLGVHLFEDIVGDHFTVLGLPLIGLLAAFRSTGLVTA